MKIKETQNFHSYTPITHLKEYFEILPFQSLKNKEDYFMLPLREQNKIFISFLNLNSQSYQKTSLYHLLMKDTMITSIRHENSKILEQIP